MRLTGVSGRFGCGFLTDWHFADVLQIILHVLDRVLSMVPVLCHNVIIHKVLDVHHGFCEGYSLGQQGVQNRCRKHWDNPTPEYSSHLNTPLCHMAIWYVQWSETRIWIYHCAEMVEFGDPGILFHEGHYPVYQMLQHTEIDGMKNNGSDNCRWWDVFDIPDDIFWGSNGSICKILSWFPSLRLISLSSKYCLLEV